MLVLREQWHSIGLPYVLWRGVHRVNVDSSSRTEYVFIILYKFRHVQFNYSFDIVLLDLI